MEDRIVITRDDRGRYGLRLLDGDGKPVEIVSGGIGAPNARYPRRKYWRAVQAALKSEFEHRQAAAS